MQKKISIFDPCAENCNSWTWSGHAFLTRVQEIYCYAIKKKRYFIFFYYVTVNFLHTGQKCVSRPCPRITIFCTRVKNGYFFLHKVGLMDFFHQNEHKLGSKGYGGWLPGGSQRTSDSAQDSQKKMEQKQKKACCGWVCCIPISVNPLMDEISYLGDKFIHTGLIRCWFGHYLNQ